MQSRSVNRGIFLLAVSLVFSSCGGFGAAARSLTPQTQALAMTPVNGIAIGRNVRIGWRKGDDWEPYIAADRFGHLYAIITHLNGRHLQAQRSDDGGATWTVPVDIDPTPTRTGQFDPWMTIDPIDGRSVSVTYMQDDPASAIRMVTSHDLGVTWSKPIAVSGRLSHLDKDAMAVRGKTIAVCFDNFFTLFAAVSNDAGRTWKQHRMTSFARAPLQFLCSGAGIDSRGKIFFSWDSSDARSTAGHPAAEVWVESSANGGKTWIRKHVDYGGSAYQCIHCGAGAFFGSQMSLAIATDDTVYLLWNATPSVADRVPQRIYFSRSIDGGTTFAPRREVSLAPAGTEHGFPTVLAGSSPADVRIAWEDRRNGRWNVYYRSSTDAGRTWSTESTLSNFVPGYAYLKRTGFAFPYGDYFRMTIDRGGKLHAAWGETSYYTNPGNIWVANQR